MSKYSCRSGFTLISSFIIPPLAYLFILTKFPLPYLLTALLLITTSPGSSKAGTLSPLPLPGTTPPLLNPNTRPPPLIVAGPPIEVILFSRLCIADVRDTSALVLFFVASAAFAMVSAFSFSLEPLMLSPIF